MKKVLFRVDSSSSIGLGHVMRCLTLAQRLSKNSIEVIFASKNLEGNINSKIKLNGFELRVIENDSSESLATLIKELDIDLLIIDSYEIDYGYEKSIYDLNICKILAFDDLLIPHCAHMILNHGLHINKDSYKKIMDDKTKLFCGSQTTILRDEFFEKYNSKIEKDSIALLLGGNDALNILPKLIDLLKAIKSFKITVITSRSNQNIKKIENKNIDLKLDIDNIAQELSSSEFIICATSTVLFELMALKKKFINIKVANNQNSIVEFLELKNIKTTLQKEDISIESLKEKIEYISKNEIYDKLDINFSKTALVEKILKEI